MTEQFKSYYVFHKGKPGQEDTNCKRTVWKHKRLTKAASAWGVSSLLERREMQRGTPYHIFFSLRKMIILDGQSKSMLFKVWSIHTRYRGEEHGFLGSQSIQHFQGVRSQKGGNHMEMRAKYCSKFPLTYLLFSAYARGNYN